jgi:putative acetyltransferase
MFSMIPSGAASSSESTAFDRIDLRPIATGEANKVRAVLDAGFRGLWGLGLDEIAAGPDALEDLEDPSGYYAERGGVFLVLVHGDRCVGTGGVLALDEETAELRRLWLLDAYRGRGLGRRLAEALLVYARARGCRRIRLEVRTPDRQAAAVRLCSRLGFKRIEGHRSGPCALAMEKIL